MRLKAVDLQRRSKGMNDIMVSYVQVVVEVLKRYGVEVDFDRENNQLIIKNS